MDSHDLRTILQQNRVTQGIFLDVFALDHLPTAIELKGANRWFLVCIDEIGKNEECPQKTVCDERTRCKANVIR